MEKIYYVYIMTNDRNTVLYVGVTNDLERRVWEHKNKIGQNFTSKYNATKLVYFQTTNDINVAIEYEKKIKAGSRKRKITLIEDMNSTWKDLSWDCFAIARNDNQKGGKT